ncbi:MAG: 2-oxoacid:acceptor oxidoreductase family protein [Eubacteriales bacterium]|nr:2-oxoacid:acceptor oxidoreductase family protein [Eubacteriales bacterium]
MKLEMLFSGIGGQGIMRLGEILCDAAIKSGYLVTFSPFYGQEKRGGRTMCNIVISEEVESPIISEAQVMLIMDERSLADYSYQLSPEGTLILNSSMIESTPDVKCKRIDRVPFYGMAQELGNTKTANMVALGYVMKYLPEIDKDVVIECVKAGFAGKPKLIPLNVKAFEAGYNYEA